MLKIDRTLKEGDHLFVIVQPGDLRNVESIFFKKNHWAESKQWKMTRFSDLSPAWGKQGNSVYLSVPEKAGCLSLSKTASFTLRTMSFHVFMGTWNPAKTHEWETRPNSPWPVYTSPCQKWGSFRGVSAPLPSGLQAYVIFFFYITGVLNTAFSMERFMIYSKMHCLKM